MAPPITVDIMVGLLRGKISSAGCGNKAMAAAGFVFPADGSVLYTKWPAIKRAGLLPARRDRGTDENAQR